MKIWRLLLQTIGATSIILCAWGFDWLIVLFPHGIKDNVPEAPYFRTVFLVMNAIDVVFLTAMIIASVGLLRSKRFAVKAYSGISVCLLVWAFAPGLLWGLPSSLGTSIAAASGVGDMGLAPLLLYPVSFIYLIVTVILANVAIRGLKNNVPRMPQTDGGTQSQII